MGAVVACVDASPKSTLRKRSFYCKKQRRRKPLNEALDNTIPRTFKESAFSKTNKVNNQNVKPLRFGNETKSAFENLHSPVCSQPNGVRYTVELFSGRNGYTSTSSAGLILLGKRISSPNRPLKILGLPLRLVTGSN